MNYYTVVSSSLGEVTIQCTENGISGIWFETNTTKPNQLGKCQAEHPILQQAVKQLNEYFSGKRKAFELPIEVEGTEFQKQVWNALRKIPYGETWTYAQIATSIGRPKAVRAVGTANGKNPVSIVVPCHRVIGSNGTLAGYAGGVERKAFLLNLEGI